MSVRNTVKSIQDIMRQDSGVDGDAQRISQLCWMFFLKIIDDQDQELELRAVVPGGHAPFTVVIVDVELVALETPRAANAGDVGFRGRHAVVYALCLTERQANSRGHACGACVATTSRAA